MTCMEIKGFLFRSLLAKCSTSHKVTHKSLLYRHSSLRYALKKNAIDHLGHFSDLLLRAHALKRRQVNIKTKLTLKEDQRATPTNLFWQWRWTKPSTSTITHTAALRVWLWYNLCRRGRTTAAQGFLGLKTTHVSLTKCLILNLTKDSYNRDFGPVAGMTCNSKNTSNRTTGGVLTQCQLRGVSPFQNFCF